MKGHLIYLVHLMAKKGAEFKTAIIGKETETLNHKKRKFDLLLFIKNIKYIVKLGDAKSNISKIYKQ